VALLVTLANGNVAHHKRVSDVPVLLELGNRCLSREFFAILSQGKDFSPLGHTPRCEPGTTEIGELAGIKLPDALGNQCCHVLANYFVRAPAEDLLRAHVEVGDPR